MKSAEAYRRILSWPEDWFGGMPDDPMAKCFHGHRCAAGIRYRPLFIEAAASLSGQLPRAQSDEDLVECANKYSEMAVAGRTSWQELRDEMFVLLGEINGAGLQEHQLN